MHSPSKLRLEGKVAIVTGSGRGIGRAIARLFAAEGAKVAVVSLTPSNVDSVVAEIQEEGGTAIGIPTDISNAEQIKQAVAETVEAFGGLDILVNNAFDSSAPFSDVASLSLAQLQRNFDTGPIAYLQFMQAAYPHLQARGEGRIINFGSSAGVIGLPGYTPYNMAKEAVRALTRTAAKEWGQDQITVNNVLPIAETWGPEHNVPAPTNALGRFGSPAPDIAPVVLFLASNDARFITGSSLTPDGGFIIDSAR